MFKIIEAIAEGRKQLSSVSPTPGFDAELILSAVTGLTIVQIIASPEKQLSQIEHTEFLDLLGRRVTGEPVAYILGLQEFWSLPFFVTPAVLIPRPETELIVERALVAARDLPDPIRLLDLATGSGCIVVSLVKELNRAGRVVQAFATDISAEALAVACENIDRHGLNNLIRVVEGDWFKPFKPGRNVFDLITANPPYIAKGDPAVSPSTKFEPQSALYSGAEGLDALQILIKQAPLFLTEAGTAFFEIGAAQAEAVAKICAENLSTRSWTIFKDLSDKDRVLEIK